MAASPQIIKKGHGSAIGHTFGVKVQRGQRGQRGRLTALRAEGCGRLSAAGYVRFAQGATAPTALRVVDCRRAAMLIKSALRDWLYESYILIRITVISHLRWLFPPLVPYGTTFPPLYRSGDKRKAPLWAG